MTLVFSNSTLLMTALRLEDIGKSVSILCQDGKLEASGLFLAAISPLIKDLGQSEPDLELCLPDFCVNQVQTFLRILTSENGPCDEEEQIFFCDWLEFWGHSDPFLDQPMVNRDMVAWYLIVLRTLTRQI